MKIGTKIAAGYGVLLALILAVLSYQVFLINQMQAINRDLSGINFRASIVSLQLLRDLDQIEEFTRKFYVTADPGYSSQIEEMRSAFSQGLQEVLSLPLSSAEQEEMDSLSGLWDEFLRIVSENKSQPLPTPPQLEAELSNQLTLLTRLRFQTQSLIRATRLAIASRVEQSAQASQRAQRVSWIAALATFLVSLGVSFWIVRSISKPFQELTAGTRAVAEGQFYYQLDASGNDELAHLARDFNTMTRRLGELDQMKKDFVSHISHELKSPLASVRETMRILLEEIPGPLAPPQKRLLELSLQSGNRLSSMIGNLLDLSRIEAGAMEYDIRKHDLCTLVRTALAEFEVQTKERKLQMEAQLPDAPVSVECDSDRILQVIGNVVGNALKFSPPGSAIRVCLRRLKEMPNSLPATWREKLSGFHNSDNFVLLSVTDCGPGIPGSEKERIFEKFHQVRQTGTPQLSTGSSLPRPIRQSGHRGVGLGLAIARTIVEAHRGAIWVEDNTTGGSTFHILLAAGAVRAETPSRVSSPI